MRCAVLGDPVDHSLSPVLHRAGYAAVGLADVSYDAVRVPAGTLAAYVDGLDDSWRGLSLTMPLKRELLVLAGERGWLASDRARLAGAANTLVLGPAPSVDNTDLPGATAAVRERWDGEIADVAILGAGATAASVGLALCDLGAHSVTVLARSAERAAETVAAVAAHPARPVVVAADLTVTAPAQVLVSTIPVEAQERRLVAAWRDVPVVFDVVYDPWPTPLAAAAGERGQVLVSGLDLLVHQAALQFEVFTGRSAPLAAMREAGESALAARAGHLR